MLRKQSDSWEDGFFTWLHWLLTCDLLQLHVCPKPEWYSLVFRWSLSDIHMYSNEAWVIFIGFQMKFEWYSGVFRGSLSYFPTYSGEAWVIFTCIQMKFEWHSRVFRWSLTDIHMYWDKAWVIFICIQVKSEWYSRIFRWSLNFLFPPSHRINHGALCKMRYLLLRTSVFCEK